MTGRALGAALAALLTAAPLPAGAADSPRPLRTLTFAVEVSVLNAVDTPGALLSNGPGPAVIVKGGRVIGRPAAITGSGDKHSAERHAVKGTISVEVLHATGDSGLVLDISEDANGRKHPKVRLGVAADGTLLYDPARASDLSDEELQLGHWLARGFYGDHPREVGTSWTVDQSTNGRTDVEHYRVVARDDPRVTLQYSLEERTDRVAGYTGIREGSLVYDTALVVPVKALLESVARNHVGDQYATRRSSLQLLLTADSFARR